ncbi:ion transporter [Paludifilum halophilum]|uniref:Voltage-gated sodium channel n=1 Tax=Paludifilum halophilum TaxID=1642702 RepID=A0A235B4W6_9BACL|nr:ion transporter [Paludifilum halophilum]OYD07350.1 voltage-gated sodium channel [Paludifilum halophilum]
MEPQRATRSYPTSFSERINRFVQQPWFTGTILGLILIHAILLGLETYPTIYQSHQDFFHVADKIILWIFTLEVVLKMIAARPWHRFFHDPWNAFDFFIVASGHIFIDVQFVVVLRILRVLRVLRAISILPALRRLVKTLMMTIPTLGNIMILLSIIFYIFAVTGTILFRDAAPQYFGSLHRSMLSLFQIVTLDSWASEIMWPIQEEKPWAWIYFVAFVLVGTFIILNLLIGVIVNKVEKVAAEEEELEELRKEAALQEEIRALREEVQDLKSIMNRQSSPSGKTTDDRRTGR